MGKLFSAFLSIQNFFSSADEEGGVGLNRTEFLRCRGFRYIHSEKSKKITL